MKIIFLMLFLLGCAGIPQGLRQGVPQGEGQDRIKPWVVSMNPVPSAIIDELPEIRVSFTEPMNPETFTDESVLVFSGLTQSASSLSLEAIEDLMTDKSVQTHPGSFELSANKLELVWMPMETLQKNTKYFVLLKPSILSATGLPLGPSLMAKQNHFLAELFIRDFIFDATESVPLETAETQIFPVKLIINELYYDVEGDETDGHAFVELYGQPGKADLKNYRLQFINGSDAQVMDEIVFNEKDQLSDEGLFVVADGITGSTEKTRVEFFHRVEQFDPQNGPDAVRLIDPQGQVIDALGYGDKLPAMSADNKIVFEGTPAQDVDSGSSLSRWEKVDSNDNNADFVRNTKPSPNKLELTSFIELAEQKPVVMEPVVEAPANLEPMAEADPEIPADPPVILSDLKLTELVVDPQQDWNDSSGGNDMPFDNIPGTGTIGTTDEWIELKNFRDEAVDLTHWHVSMNDGTDVQELFSESKANLVFSLDGDITNFQADEVLVIGNPGGDMKNTVHVLLYDETDSLVDEVFLEDGNADDESNESFFRNENGAWIQGGASINF